MSTQEKVSSQHDKLDIDWNTFWRDPMTMSGVVKSITERLPIISRLHNLTSPQLRAALHQIDNNHKIVPDLQFPRDEEVLYNSFIPSFPKLVAELSVMHTLLQPEERRSQDMHKSIAAYFTHSFGLGHDIGVETVEDLMHFHQILSQAIHDESEENGITHWQQLLNDTFLKKQAHTLERLYTSILFGQTIIEATQNYSEILLHCDYKGLPYTHKQSVDTFENPGKDLANKVNQMFQMVNEKGLINLDQLTYPPFQSMGLLMSIARKYNTFVDTIIRQQKNGKNVLSSPELFNKAMVMLKLDASKFADIQKSALQQAREVDDVFALTDYPGLQMTVEFLHDFDIECPDVPNAEDMPQEVDFIKMLESLCTTVMTP